MEISKLFNLLKLKISRKGKGSTNIIVILLLLLSLGVSIYFNLNSSNKQVVFNFEEQVDSLVGQKIDSISNEITNYYKPRILQYEELAISKNEELANLRRELEFKEIKIKDLQTQTNIGIVVSDDAVIPIERVEDMMDSLEITLTSILSEVIFNQLSDSMQIDSSNIVESLMGDPTFIKTMLDRLTGAFTPDGQIQFQDTTTHLKYFGVIDLKNDSLYRTYVYNIALQHSTFFNRNGLFKQPTHGLALTVDDENAKLNVETFFMKPPQLNAVLSAGIGGGVYYDIQNNKFGLAPTITVTLGYPLLKIYSRRN